MRTFYRDFCRPTREGVPDRCRSRAAEFVDKRSNLGHNVLVILLPEHKGYRIYFSPWLLNTENAKEVPGVTRRP